MSTALVVHSWMLFYLTRQPIPANWSEHLPQKLWNVDITNLYCNWIELMIACLSAGYRGCNPFHCSTSRWYSTMTGMLNQRNCTPAGRKSQDLKLRRSRDRLGHPAGLFKKLEALPVLLYPSAESSVSAELGQDVRRSMDIHGTCSPSTIPPVMTEDWIHAFCEYPALVEIGHVIAPLGTQLCSEDTLVYCWSTDYMTIVSRHIALPSDVEQPTRISWKVLFSDWLDISGGKISGGQGSWEHLYR